MKKRRISSYQIVIFLATFAAFGIFTTIQMRVIGENIDYKAIPTHHLLIVITLWGLAAAGFTALTTWQMNNRFQKPIEKFAEATRKVASGDFSVYVPPRNLVYRKDALDTVFENFNKMVEELGSIETLKTDFFSNVSHEIKTPLAVIHNNAELLMREDITEEQRMEYAETILLSTRRLSDLITNMLKLNKLEKQVITPTPEEYDICAQLCECALQFESVWDKKNIEFIADIEDRATVQADRGLLELVWTNLLSNALKFTPEGGTVTLSQTSDKNEITVTVSDTGCGMDDETKRRIFEKFYQGDTSHATEGNGLGLALVSRILELTDGSITVRSTLGEGTSFTVTLPVNPIREDI